MCLWMCKMKQQENCWQKRNKLEKILIVIIFLLLCFLLSLFIILLLHLGHLFKTATERRAPTQCMSAQCVKTAAQIIDFIDPSVDPCDNFYRFACGGLFNKSLEMNQSSTISKLEAITLNKLDALITQPTTEPLDKPLQLQRKFYESCMNTTAIDEDKNNALIDLIVKLGDWPIRLGRLWDKKKFHWLWSMVKCRNLGVGHEYFMRFKRIEATPNGTRLMLLSMSPPVRANVPSQFIEYYTEMMINISLQLGAINYDYAKTEFNRVLQFEDQIKQFIAEEEKYGKNEIVQLGTLQTQFPFINWVDFLNNITGTSTPFTIDSWVYFRAKIYLSRLIHLLERTLETTQANYVIWKTVESYSSHLNKEHRTRYNSFLASLNPGRPINRKAFCLRKAKFYFPSVAEVAYVRKYVRPEVREDIKLMVKNIKQQFVNKMRENERINNESKPEPLLESKVNEIKEYVGASDRVYQENFDEIVNLEGFDLDTDNVFEMTLKLHARRTDNYFKIINRNFKNVTQEILEKSPIFGTNVMDMYQYKTLVLFAPLLQGMLYDFGRPQYVNYGTIGSLIDQALTSSLLLYENDHDESEIWSEDTMKKYESRFKCFFDKFNEYMESLGDTSGRSLEVLRNLLDLIAPNLAQQAYQQWVRTHDPELTLPGLDYTPDQVFWIVFGATKCQQPSASFDLAAFSLPFNLRNSPEFASAFNCSVGSNMNPEKKCQFF